MKFSILIPVYNVEEYLDECLKSVLSQKYTDYEVLLVNDGSTDGSPKICEHYAQKDKRIKYYSKNNEGLLLTRRFAIKLAQGDYVLFLDSDDYWKSNTLERIAYELNRNPVDLLLYRFDRVRDNGDLIRVDNGIFDDKKLFTFEDKEVFIKEFVSSSRLNAMWSKCVRRLIIDVDYDYSGFSDKKGEDLLQSINLVKNAQSILYLDDSLYCYRLSASGRGRNFKFKYLLDFEIVRTHVLTVLEEMGVSKDVIDSFSLNYYLGLLGLIKIYASFASGYFEYKNTLSKVLEMNTCQRVIDNISNNIPRQLNKGEFYCIKNKRLFGIYLKNRLFYKIRSFFSVYNNDCY